VALSSIISETSSHSLGIPLLSRVRQQYLLRSFQIVYNLIGSSAFATHGVSNLRQSQVVTLLLLWILLDSSKKRDEDILASAVSTASSSVERTGLSCSEYHPDRNNGNLILKNQIREATT
jgi:hypothetical protein